MLKQAIRVESDPDDFIEQYNDMLDETYGDFMDMNASYILKECDPTVYRCGLLDYVDSYREEKYECPICGEEYQDEDEALYCCQDEEDC